MSQVNYGGENYQTQTGQGNVNFLGGNHYHHYPQSPILSDNEPQDSSHSSRLTIEQNHKLNRKNIFLEIFNPDSRLVLGVYDDLNSKAHYAFLVRSLNASVFLCDDFVIMPPTFLLECPIVLRVMREASPFMAEGIMRLPMRDRSFSDFYEKKLEEYSEVTENYPGMFGRMGPQAVNLMRKHSQTKIERNSKIGQGIAQMWAAGPDINPYWKRHISLIPANILDKVRYIPETLHDRGRAITYGLVAKQSPYEETGMPVSLIQKLLQHSYSALYINEYDLKVVSNLPFSQDVFGHGLNNLPYDFEALRAALKPIGLFDIILTLPAQEMIALRYSYAYTKFISVFDEIAHRCSSSSQIRRHFTLAAASCSSQVKKCKSDLEKIIKRKEFSATDDKINSISEILLESSLALS